MSFRMNAKHALSMFWRIFKKAIAILVVLILLLTIVSSIAERGYKYLLPNGVLIGRKHAFAGVEDIYLWKPNGEIVHDAVVEFLCMSDRYIYANQWGGVDFIYEIHTDILTLDGSENFYYKRSETGLFVQKGCTGYTHRLTGAYLIFSDPYRFFK